MRYVAIAVGTIIAVAFGWALRETSLDHENERLRS